MRFSGPIFGVLAALRRCQPGYNSPERSFQATVWPLLRVQPYGSQHLGLNGALPPARMVKLASLLRRTFHIGLLMVNMGYSTSLQTSVTSAERSQDGKRLPH